ncbi:MAG: amidohydrolase family protein [Gemmatimonadota bacterium]
MAGPPIRHGAVLVDDAGRIAAVGPDSAVPHPEGVPAEAFPGAGLMPGLVNTHTHLELTGFEGQVPDDDFAAWIRRVRTLKAERSAEDFLAAARAGLAHCFAAGVTTVAETGDSGAVAAALVEAGGSGIVYQEVFGPHCAQRDESMNWLARRLDELEAARRGRVRIGVSPHAPYTVSGPLYESAARLARERGLPMAVHLAESRAETALLATGTGPFADAWVKRGIPLPPPGHSPVEWLDRHGVLGPDTLCIHVVQVSQDDIARLAARGVAIAHCPRSNRRHGHGDAPLGALLAAGLRVGVGTDSVASVGVLDLLADVRAARALAGLDASAALRLVTLDAARALDLDREIGSLEPGKWADFAVIDLGPAADDPVERVLASRPADVVATFLAGAPVARRESRFARSPH